MDFQEGLYQIGLNKFQRKKLRRICKKIQKSFPQSLLYIDTHPDPEFFYYNIFLEMSFNFYFPILSLSEGFDRKWYLKIKETYFQIEEVNINEIKTLITNRIMTKYWPNYNDFIFIQKKQKLINKILPLPIAEEIFIYPNTLDDNQKELYGILTEIIKNLPHYSIRWNKKLFFVMKNNELLIFFTMDGKMNLTYYKNRILKA